MSFPWKRESRSLKYVPFGVPTTFSSRRRVAAWHPSPSPITAHPVRFTLPVPQPRFPTRAPAADPAPSTKASCARPERPPPITSAWAADRCVRKTPAPCLRTPNARRLWATRADALPHSNYALRGLLDSGFQSCPARSRALHVFRPHGTAGGGARQYPGKHLAPAKRVPGTGGLDRHHFCSTHAGALRIFLIAVAAKIQLNLLPVVRFRRRQDPLSCAAADTRRARAHRLDRGPVFRDQAIPDL
jgi:hypothetical protein